MTQNSYIPLKQPTAGDRYEEAKLMKNKWTRTRDIHVSKNRINLKKKAIQHCTKWNEKL